MIIKKIRAIGAILKQSGFGREARLAELDNKRGYTNKAHAYAQELGHNIGPYHGDFGRNLAYYSEIHGLMKRYLRRIKGKKILHLGASTGIYAKFLQDHGAKAIALDISMDAARIAKHVGNKSIVRADSRILGGNIHSLEETRRQQHLPFRNNSLDAFVSDHFLLSGYNNIEFTSSSILVLQDLNRVLKPGGIGIVYNYHINALLNCMERLLNIGFTVKEVRGKNDFTFRALVLKKL